MKKNLLKLSDLSAKEILSLLKQAHVFKKLRGKKKNPQPLKDKTLCMIFEKSSTRTRVSFEVAMQELGGYALSINAQESQIGRGESYQDTALVLSRYVHGIMLRTHSQKNLEELALFATVPVINGLSDLFHPVQLLADLMTIQELKKDLRKIKVAYVGDGNNLANSWIEASILLGFKLRVGCPKGYEASAQLLGQAKKHSQISFTADPMEALRGADVVYTDTWFSMGQEVDEKKKNVFAPFQINAKLLGHAAPKAMVLHCLPAHRGEEITSDILDGPQSYVWQQAENRLHVQKAVLVALL